MNNLQEVLSLISKGDIPTVFELMDGLGLGNSDYYKLKKEFISNRVDNTFYQRLRLVVQELLLIETDISVPKQQRPLREFLDDTKQEEGLSYKIVTFYSFKGGAGRSQLLANMAAYMCYHLKKRVLIIDWDLEAPGIDKFFKQVQTQAKPFERAEVGKGLIDFFKSYVDLANEKRDLDESNLPTLTQEYIHTLVAYHASAKIDFIPAVNYNDANYSHTVNHLDWFDFYERLQGRYFIEILKKQLHAMPYDVILIDSRTGISDYSGICNIQLPDVNVVLTVPTDQSIEGAKDVIEKILKSPYTQKVRPRAVVLPVLSRVETSNNAGQNKWRVSFEKNFKEIITKTLENQRFTDTVESYISHTYLKHDNELAYGENLLFTPDAEQVIVQDSIEEAMLHIFKYMDTQPERDLQKEIEDILTTIKQLKKINTDTKVIETLYVELARLYYENDNYENALAYYEKVMPLIEENAEDLRKLGNCYLEENNIEKAKFLYEKILTLNIQDYKAWYNLGVVYYTLQDYKSAKKYYEKVLEINPNYVYAWNNLGYIYYDLQDYDNAKKHYEKALEISPNDVRLLYNSAVLYNNIGKYTNSEKYLHKLLEIEPDNKDAQELLTDITAKLQDN